MRRYWFVPSLAIVLVATACSSGSENSAPAAVATETASQPTEPAETPVMLSTDRHDLADAMLTVMLQADERPILTADKIPCMANGLAGVFSDDRLVNLGLNGPSVTAIYEARGTFALGDAYEITDRESSELVDLALECVDWRAVLVEEIAGEGLSPEQARCIASEISDEAIRLFAMNALISEQENEFGYGDVEIQAAIQVCVDLREMLYETYVLGGLSEQSARCLSDGLPEDLLGVMFAGEEPELDDEESLELIGEILELQNRCLTPEELALMGGSDISPGSPPLAEFGSGTCPPSDGSGPQVLDFDGPQPLCLDPAKQYTAVFDTTAGEMRIALDIVNTPITANNFAVLALYHYYDDTQLFRTDPGIGIIQGGAPHTNSPSDPGPGYTIPDEGQGFTYEPGQIVMARTAAPNSASAQFFFAVNENTALLNGQGTYVVFGQMDDESLAVAEAILASHVDQPDNPLGGGPEPPVVVNSVTIEESR